MTPVMISSALGHKDVLRLLLNAASQAKQERHSALDAGIAGGHLEIVSFLCQDGAEVNMHIRESTPLVRSALDGHAEIMRLLFSARGDPSQPGSDGRTPLLAAVRGGHVAIVRLLGELDVVRRHVAPNGISALVRAAADNQLDVVMALVQARASINEQQQTGGFVPLHAAVNRGHLEVARYLCTSRANVACYADHGLTPLSNAAWAGHDEIVQFLQERLALVP